MNHGRGERKEDRVRRMLAGPYPAVPAGLGAEAAALGERLLRRRTRVRWVLAAVVTAAVIAAVVWLAIAEPWLPPPDDTTPPLSRW